jgi:hypothetical protein
MHARSQLDTNRPLEVAIEGQVALRIDRAIIFLMWQPNISPPAVILLVTGPVFKDRFWAGLVTKAL